MSEVTAFKATAIEFSFQPPYLREMADPTAFREMVCEFETFGIAGELSFLQLWHEAPIQISLRLADTGVTHTLVAPECLFSQKHSAELRIAIEGLFSRVSETRN